MIFELLAGRGKTVATEIQLALDFVDIFPYTSDGLYLTNGQIVLITDDFNTYSSILFYKAFLLEEACRLAKCFEWHCIKRYGSRLDMSEFEIGIMKCQALTKLLTDLADKRISSYLDN